MRLLSLAALSCLIAIHTFAAEPKDIGPAPGPVPQQARLVLVEDWSGGQIDPAKWYMPRKKWGGGNNGVTRDNVRLARDTVEGREQNVLVCEAHGDQYDGPVVGFGGHKTRVGGVIVSKGFFASGRFEVVMKVGSTEPHPGGPADPRRPKGTVVAIWTYAYRYVSVPRDRMDEFVPAKPLYNPLMKRYGKGANEYWSELDFPELGKAGNFDVGMYNTFLQDRHQPNDYDVSAAIDGKYHTFTTEWHTKLEPMERVSDADVIESEGFWWVRNKSVPFEHYYGNPLKRLGPDRYAVYRGDRVDHWIDGKKEARNTKYVPAMAAQLTMGVWLPDWVGPAAWRVATMSVASVKVWQFDDEGDVRGVLKEDLADNFSGDGTPLR